MQKSLDILAESLISYFLDLLKKFIKNIHLI